MISGLTFIVKNADVCFVENELFVDLLVVLSTDLSVH